MSKNELVISAVFVGVLLCCALFAISAPLIDVATVDLRYGLLHNTQQYQTGLETEVLQMQQEYFDITNCNKKDAMKNLIQQKYNQLNNPEGAVYQNMNKINGELCYENQ